MPFILRHFATIYCSDYNGDFTCQGSVHELLDLGPRLGDLRPLGAFLACRTVQTEMNRERKILRAEIVGAHRTERISISAISDFSLGKARAVPDVGAVEGTLLPYCLDFVHRRAVYVGGVGAGEAQEVPFYYLHLRRAARTTVTVPWELTHLCRDELRAPILLFSPGRCGSTLVSRILYEAGVVNVSEADFYKQATSKFSSSQLNPLRRGLRKAESGVGRAL